MTKALFLNFEFSVKMNNSLLNYTYIQVWSGLKAPDVLLFVAMTLFTSLINAWCAYKV